jgi:hypothetical protein
VSGDPVRLLWDPLAQRGYRPHGTEYEFRARCPAHDGENPTSLSVRVGADGLALVWCHAHQCHVQAITAALDLAVADLFPDGHPRCRRYPLSPLTRSDFAGSPRRLANVLCTLGRLGEPWLVMLACRCPYCSHPGGWLRADRGHVDFDCPGGYDTTALAQALLGRLSEQETAT